MSKKALTQDEVIKILKAACVISTQKHVAANLGVSPAYLSDILHGRREISEQFAERLGYKRIVRFEDCRTV